MKRIISLIILITMVFGVISINAQENTDIVSTAPQGNLVDDCVDFSNIYGRSENVYPSVTAEEDKYAFDDYTMFMRNEATAQWIDYEIPENQYLIFHTYFRQNEEISHFSFMSSTDGENWKEEKPIIKTVPIESWKWIPVIYTLKNISSDAKYIRIIFGNIGKTVWSPSIAGVYSRYINESDSGFADCVGTKYYDSTKLLKNLKLISGYSQYEYRPENKITRAEFAKMMAVYMNLYTDGKSNRVFYDLSAEHWANSSVTALYGVGVINGDENENFNPDAEITYTEAVKMIVSALGYSAAAEGKGGYPVGFEYYAKRFGLDKDIETVGDKPINRGEAAIIFVNSLDDEMMYQVEFGGEDVRFKKDGTTVLEYYHEIYKADGVLSDIGNRSIISDSIHSNDRCVINDVEYKLGEFDLSDLFAHRVSAYVKYEGRSDIGTVLYAENDDCELIEITPLEYSGIDGNYITYTDDDGREHKCGFTNNTRVIYNGRYDTRMGMVNELEFNSGFMRLIKYSHSSLADIILIENYNTYHIGSVGRLGGGITDKDKGLINLEIDKAEEVFVYQYGEKIEYSPEIRLNPEDIFQVAHSKDKRVAYINISNSVLNGTVTSIKEDKLFIDGDVFDIASCFDKKQLKDLTGKEVIAYFDINGYIAYIEDMGDKTQYGYLISGADMGSFSTEGSLRIVVNDREVVEYTVNDLTRLNGKKAAVADITKYKDTLVRITSRDGVITNLEIPEIKINSVGCDVFSLNYKSDSSKYYGDNMKLFSSIYQLDGNTKVFVLPKDRSKTEDYRVKDCNHLITNKSYNVSLYDIDNNYLTGAVVIDLNGSEDRYLESFDNIAVIRDVEHINDKDGNPCLAVSVYVNGQESYVYFDSDGGIDVTYDWLWNYAERNTANGNNPFSKGEVFQYYMDDESHCRYFRMLLTADIIENDGFYERHTWDYGPLTEQSYFSELYTAYGTVSKKLNGKMIINPTANYQRTILLSNANIYRYNSKENKIYIGDETDIFEGSSVFVRLNFTTVKEVIVIE